MPSLGMMKAVGLSVAALVLFLAGYTVRGWKDDAARLKEQRAAQAAQNKLVQDWAANMTAATQRMTTAETQHDKDQLLINRLRADAERVRIHIPVCPAASAAGTTQAGPGGDGSAGVFSERIDAAFSEFQHGVAELAARCDQLNIDARRLNAVLGAAP